MDGSLVSTTSSIIRFDFSQTISERELVKFGIDIPNNGIEISVNSDESSTIEVEFTEHGIHDLVAYVMDNKEIKRYANYK